MHDINVLSLFDGISCGRVALDRAGISVKNYYASEIDKYAIKVSENNYPDIVRLGDVNNWQSWNIDWSSIDLVMAGSPCQGFSFAGKQLAFNDHRSQLFFVFVNILNRIKKLNPNIKFLLENVRMKKEYIQVISDYLSVEPVLINSSLVSAQDRKRLYWCNWELSQPEDKGILLKDILLTNNSCIKQLPRGKNKGNLFYKKSPTLTCNSWQHNNTIITIGKCYSLTTNKGEGLKIGLIRVGTANDIKGHDYNKRIYSDKGKSPTLTASSGGNLEPKVAVNELIYRKLTTIECERLQTLNDGYTEGISNSQRYKCLGNSWTVDVIAHILKCLVDQPEISYQPEITINKSSQLSLFN